MDLQVWDTAALAPMGNALDTVFCPCSRKPDPQTDGSPALRSEPRQTLGSTEQSFNTNTPILQTARLRPVEGTGPRSPHHLEGGAAHPWAPVAALACPSRALAQSPGTRCGCCPQCGSERRMSPHHLQVHAQTRPSPQFPAQGTASWLSTLWALQKVPEKKKSHEPKHHIYSSWFTRVKVVLERKAMFMSLLPCVCACAQACKHACVFAPCVWGAVHVCSHTCRNTHTHIVHGHGAHMQAGVCPHTCPCVCVYACVLRILPLSTG